MDTPTRQRVVDFVTASKRGRRMPYCQVSIELHLFVSDTIIRNALAKEGYHRRVARKKPPISEKNRVLRLAWTHEHLNWTHEQWNLLLWTDETWVTDERHNRYVKRCNF
jgi:hypothetical protein